jgi:hypothetical protein
MSYFTHEQLAVIAKCLAESCENLMLPDEDQTGSVEPEEWHDAAWVFLRELEVAGWSVVRTP